MTLKRSEEAALWYVDPPPQTGKLENLAQWAYLLLDRLANFLRRPEFPGIVLVKLDATVQAEFKPEAGLLVYAGAGTLGPQEGLYVYEGTPGAGGAWKKIAGT